MVWGPANWLFRGLGALLVLGGIANLLLHRDWVVALVLIAFGALSLASTRPVTARRERRVPILPTRYLGLRHRRRTAHAWDLFEHGVRGTAVVTDVQRTHWRLSQWYPQIDLTLEYAGPDGELEKHERLYLATWAIPSVGARLPIAYAPADPRDVAVGLGGRPPAPGQCW